MKKRRSVLSLLLACVTVIGMGAQTVQAQGNVQSGETAPALVVSMDLEDYSGGDVLVQYRDGTFEVKTFDGQTELETALKEWADSGEVSLIQPNYTYESTALSTGDTLSSLQWALSNDGSFSMEDAASYPVYGSPWTISGIQDIAGASTPMPLASELPSMAGVDIGAQEAWSIYGNGSRDVVVALIDTGVDTSHPDLQGSLWVNADEIPGNGIDDDGNGYIDDTNGWNFYANNNQLYAGTEDSHGTHAAGTIAAQSGNGIGISGIARAGRVKVMVLKALGGNSGLGSSLSVIQAIRYAEANGATICNLSLGTLSNDPALYETIAKSSMLFVAASGNNGMDTDVTPCYPASYNLDNVISVGNLTSNGMLHTTSNYGVVSVDLAAPGTYILSTVPGSYGFMSGTSMAAPMVTAAAAMVYTYYDTSSPADVKRTLLSTTAPLPALQGKTATGGMLDLAAALSVPREQMTGAAFQLPSGPNAPQIVTSQLNMGETVMIAIRVTDADGDLCTTVYNKGALTAEQFQGGANGIPFVVDGGGSNIFFAKESDTYSFYARDLAGHETVVTITLNQ
ncbi:MAG TPA: S8 family serine peptidase [Candidatus Caccousia stercoris]|uniref:S8 family serine peptidase n=1 Tax=Candidatus Caccousia stercoris TaxID=2840723 RepID=A0A9D1FSA3_9FIRM|nr:S8 family serine peptidase [Candidatus Caccousia stercoris]